MPSFTCIQGSRLVRAITTSARSHRRPRRLAVAAGLVAFVGCSDSPTEVIVRDGTIGDLTAVTFADGRYVAVGTEFKSMDNSVVPGSDTVAIQVSTDGRTWTDVPSVVAGMLLEVTHGDGRFVAVGREHIPFAPSGPERSEPVVLTSVDGLEWSVASQVPDVAFRSVTFGNGRFVATALNLETLFEDILVSDDGDIWTAVAQTDILAAEVGFGDGQFLVWGEAGAVGRSTNGEDWGVFPVDSIGIIWDVAFLDGRFVGMGDFDCCFGEVPGTRRFYSLESLDGVVWSVRTQALEEVIFTVTFGADRFVGTIHDDIVISDDARTWSPASLSNARIADVAFGAGGFVAVGRTTWFSETGVVWERVD